MMENQPATIVYSSLVHVWLEKNETYNPKFKELIWEILKDFWSSRKMNVKNHVTR